MANAYRIDIRHEGLKKFKTITGNDVQVVQEKAAAQVAQWNDEWDKETKKQKAQCRTNEAAKVLQELNTILSSGLEKPVIVDWESLKQRGIFSRTVPTAASELAIPSAPDRKDPAYSATMGILDWFSAARRATRTEEASVRFEEDMRKWQEKKASIEAQNAKVAAEHAAKLAQWNDERASFLEKQHEQHQMLDVQKQSYLAMDADAVVDYCDLLLSQSLYPDWFTAQYDINYVPATRTLVVDYSLHGYPPDTS